jgi:hypothetical protein
MYKKLSLVMLPTNEKASKGDLTIFGNNLIVASSILHLAQVSQHLYFTSDDEINNKVLKSDHNVDYEQNHVFKIIATTDNRIKNQMLLDGFDRIYPQPSQSFIEHFVSEYNKGNVITDVLVEYEYRHDDSVPYPKTLDGKSVLKINPDNTINCSI